MVLDIVGTKKVDGIKRQLMLAVSMAFLMLTVCSVAAAADVSDNGTAVQAQNQTASQPVSHNSTGTNSVHLSNTNTNSSQSNVVKTDFVQINTVEISQSSYNSTSFSSVNTSTSNQPPKVVISGKVTKCSTGQPFSGATVTAEKDGTTLASTTTKEDGTYNLEFPSAGGVFNVTASYPGHESSTKEVNVTPDSNGTLQGTADFQLGVPTTFVDNAWVGLPNGTIVFFPGDPNPHTIGTDAFATISDGVANTNPGGTLHIADGVGPYQGPANRGITLNNDITIIGQSQAGTVIDAQGADRIFTIQPGNNVTIENLTFENGNATNGGVIFSEGNLTVKYCTFTGNTATDFFPDGLGGAIYNNGNLTVISCNFLGNKASNLGGAIFTDIGTLNITNSIFTGNTAYLGGAIWNNGGDLTITGSTFTRNTAAHQGGAIYNTSNGIITGCTFTGNSAYVGGAIENTGTLNVTGSTFTRNAAWFDDAIYNSGTANVHFSRIIGDRLANSGGTLDARFNWWGSNNDPGGRISTFDGGIVLFDPWLVLSVRADPATINNGDNSTITADLLHDNTGAYHDPAFGHVPDGIPITLATNWGSFNSPSITLDTVNGSVTAIFHANGGATPSDPVQITATAADAAVSVFVTVLGSPASTSPVLNPSQNQTQDQVQTQASIDINTNNLTNSNVNIADSASIAININNISSINTFNPIIILDNLNSV